MILFHREVQIVSYILALVFTLAGLAKLVDDLSFRRLLILRFGYPPRLATWCARALPAIEITIGLLLLMPATFRVGGWCAFALLGVLTAELFRLRARGIKTLQCGCVGGDTDKRTSYLLARNLVLMLAGVVVARYHGARDPLTFLVGLGLILLTLLGGRLIVQQRVLGEWRLVGRP
jgi:hypothetical protein